MTRILGMSVLLAGIVVGVAALAGAQGKKATGNTVSVTTTVHDYDASGVEFLMRSDDYSASGQATYGSSINGGEWDLILYNQSLRTLWITPNDPVGSQPASPPAGYYSQGVQSLSRCFDQNGNTVPLQNVITSSGNCKLGVNFNSGGTLYKLLMSPFPFSGAGDGTPICPPTGCPATGRVTVTCNKLSNSQCVSWTIAPNVSAANANIANLYWWSSKKKNSGWVFIGQYYNTFRIDVTNP
jgi:hypothetical protein